jgi:hypothetical protein
LPTENGGTHIGMFLAWVIMRGLVGETHHADSKQALVKLLARAITGRDFLVSQCDEKLWDEDFNAQGLAFAKDYYESETAFADEYSDYMQDYCDVFNAHAAANGFEYASTYHVENTWENFDRLTPILDQRFAQWQVWASNPANLTSDPKAQYQRACAVLAKQLAPFGFKPIQKGKVLKKTSKDKDLTYSIVLDESRYNSRNDVKMAVYFTVHSKKTKKWLFEQTQNTYGVGLVYYAYVKQLVKQNNPEWNIAGSDFEPSVTKMIAAIAEQALPVFEQFEQPADVAVFLAQHGTLFTAFSESESHPLAYLICAGFKVEAEQFISTYVASLPKPWRNNLLAVYKDLPAAANINLNVSECGGATDVKLAYVHGLNVHF